MKNELADLRAERDRLATEVKDSYRSVSELTAAKDAAMASVSDLQQQLDTTKDKLTNQVLGHCNVWRALKLSFYDSQL